MPRSRGSAAGTTREAALSYGAARGSQCGGETFELARQAGDVAVDVRYPMTGGPQIVGRVVIRLFCEHYLTVP